MCYILSMLQHAYTDTLNAVRFVDLFAGIGGFHLALHSFGAECVFASEWDVDAQAIYQDNFAIMPHGDITQIQAGDIPPHDILCAGFPCQAFSISGKQRGFDDTRGTLFFDVVRIAKHHQPKILLLENVKNFAKHDNGNTLRIVQKTLTEMGYTVYYTVLNASHFGMPQKRERIYVVAIRNDMPCTDFIFPSRKNTAVSLQEYMGDTPDNIQKTIIHKPIHWTPVNPQSAFYTQHCNKPMRIGTYNKGGQGERVYCAHGHAITLSAYGGGIGAKTGMYKIDKQVRKLTPRECARISGFPESYKISTNPNTAYKQFGNTVVVDVVQYIIIEIIKQKIL